MNDHNIIVRVEDVIKPVSTLEPKVTFEMQSEPIKPKKGKKGSYFICIPFCIPIPLDWCCWCCD